jgi:cell division protein FtsL
MRRPAGASVTVVPRQKKIERPELRVVAPITKTRYSRATAIIVGVTALAVLVVMFQTVIAQQQLKLDKITTEVRLARFHYDELRQQRAELRAPDNLREQAMLLGMSQGVSASFSEIPSDVVAIVLAATGSMDKEISQPPMLEDLASQAISGVTP